METSWSETNGDWSTRSPEVFGIYRQGPPADQRSAKRPDARVAESGVARNSAMTAVTFGRSCPVSAPDFRKNARH